MLSAAGMAADLDRMWPIADEYAAEIKRLADRSLAGTVREAVIVKLIANLVIAQLAQRHQAAAEVAAPNN